MATETAAAVKGVEVMVGVALVVAKVAAELEAVMVVAATAAATVGLVAAGKAADHCTEVE